MKENDMPVFTWRPLFEEIVERLAKYRDRQKELVETLIATTESDLLRDRDTEDYDVRIPLTVMDPFTFFACYLRYGNGKIAAYFQALKDHWGLASEVPIDDYPGLPRVNPQRTWFFGYAATRAPDDLDKLWDLFYEAKVGTITEETYGRALSVRLVGEAKLTEGLFWVNPETYLPVNGPVKAFFEDEGVEADTSSWSGYEQTLQRAQTYFKRPFTEISHLAYVSGQEKKSQAAVKPTEGEPLKTIKVDPEEMTKNVWKFPLNQILYGPPGTGKTYATITQAVAIVENRPPKEVEAEQRSAIQQRYRDYVQRGQIGFTTFHQSLAYEDFVEGLKPEVDTEAAKGNQNITYRVKPGIFREIVDSATEIKEAQRTTTIKSGLRIDADVIASAEYYKMSLGNKDKIEDQGIYEYCIENNCVALGWGGMMDFSASSSEQEIRALISQKRGEELSTNDYEAFAIKCLKLWMKQGDLVFISHGSNSIRAVGQITGDYYFDRDTDIRYAHFRKVRWLYKDINYPIKKIYGKQFSHQTIYGMYSGPMREGLRRELNEKTVKTNHVLIIDEINRGNVSAILGELITLLEPDKRLGAHEALTVTLPYSRDEFGVPPNLYLIGTMNTADRSVEALDAALRRRFTFREVAPDPEIISLVHDNAGIISVGELKIDLAKLLTKLNRRIKALKDADHLLGHSYFLRVNDWKDLASAFNDRIIPLLREYFFANYGQLQLVVGKGFCAEDATEMKDFAEADEDAENYGVEYKSYRFPAPDTEADLAAALHKLRLS